MKVQCPACERLVELERFRVEGEVLIVECSKCGVESRSQGQAASSVMMGTSSSPHPSGAPAPRVSLVSSPTASNVVTLKTAATDAVQKAAQSAANPFEVPATVCPKCIARRGEGSACRQCGLVFASFDPSLVAPPEWLATEWVSLLRDWGNDGAHARLRNRASERGALADLARLYRLRLALCEDDPWAAKAREEIMTLAATVALRPSPPAANLGENPKVKVAAVVLMVAMTLGAISYILSLLRAT